MTNPPDVPPPIGNEAVHGAPLSVEEQAAKESIKEAISTHEWQPTSPWTLLKLFINVLWIFAAYIFYQLTKIGFSVSFFPETLSKITEYIPWFSESFIGIFIELLIPIVFAFGPIVHWLTIRWRLDEQTIELRQGLLWRKHQKMARSRVQTVSIKADILGRLTKTRSVVISSGDTEDIVISLVSQPMAEQLRIMIAPRMKDASQPYAEYVRDPIRDALFPTTPPGTSQQAAHPDGASLTVDQPGYSGTRTDIVRLSIVDWVKYVLLNAAPHALLVLLCAIPVLIMVVVVVLNQAGDWTGVVLTTSIPAVLLSVLPVAFGVSINELNNFGFTSWIQDGRIHSMQGWISRFEKGANLARIQTVSIAQNPVRLWLKLDEITVSTADAGVSEETNDTVLKLVHPMLKAGQWRDLARDLLGVTLPIELYPPSRRTIYLGVLRTIQGGLVLAVLFGVVEYVLAGSVIAGLAIAAIALISAYPVGLWRFHNLRWAINDQCLVTRQGLIFRRIDVVPLHLVQNVRADATFIQRQLGIGNVSADIAGVNAAKVRAHDLPKDALDRVEATLVEHAKRRVNRDGV